MVSIISKLKTAKFPQTSVSKQGRVQSRWYEIDFLF